MTELAVAIGHERREHVVVRVLGRLHPEARDRWDGNWLRSAIAVAVGGFRGEITNANLRAEALKALRRGLESLYETLNGTASLESMEQWLSLTLKGDGSGQIEVTGAVSDNLGGMRNVLSFALELDQTFLPPIIDSLKAIEATYEVFTSDY